MNEYQKQAASTDTFGDQAKIEILASDPAYVAKILGLAGEAGEVAEKYKKIIRDKEGKISSDDRKELIKELGDVLWYTALLAKYLDVSLEEVAETNVNKLADRQSRSAIKGKGDNR